LMLAIVLPQLKIGKNFSLMYIITLKYLLVIYELQKRVVKLS
jgi:hypothetical protein